MQAAFSPPQNSIEPPSCDSLPREAARICGLLFRYIARRDHVTMLHLSKSRMPVAYVSVLSEHGVPAGAGLLGAHYVRTTYVHSVLSAQA